MKPAKHTNSNISGAAQLHGAGGVLVHLGVEFWTTSFVTTELQPYSRETPQWSFGVELLCCGVEPCQTRHYMNPHYTRSCNSAIHTAPNGDTVSYFLL
jgi:hypothetical protein